MLRARLYEKELERREAEANAMQASRTEIGWGHQIRSYVLQPYQLVKDLRTGHTSGRRPRCSTANSTTSCRPRWRSASMRGLRASRTWSRAALARPNFGMASAKHQIMTRRELSARGGGHTMSDMDRKLFTRPAATTPAIRSSSQRLAPRLSGQADRGGSAPDAPARRASGAAVRPGDRHVTAERLFEEATAAAIVGLAGDGLQHAAPVHRRRILREIAVDGARVYFDTNTSDHHHFLLEDDGELYDIPGSTMPGLICRSPEAQGGEDRRGGASAARDKRVRSCRHCRRSRHGLGRDGMTGRGRAATPLSRRDRRPKILLLHIAIEAGSGDAAPFSIAAAQRRDDAGREFRDGGRVVAGGEQHRLLFPGRDEAVRRPDSSECSTQPSTPSESRILRQISNSAVISTGRPARSYTTAFGAPCSAFVQIHAVGFEADETRQRQFADRPHLRLLRARLLANRQRRQNQHDGEGERQGRNLGGDP